MAGCSFGLPLVQVVAVDSNYRSVVVAAALVQAEGKDDYAFVLAGLKEAIGPDVQPDTVVVDGSEALHVAVGQAYPAAQVTLCQWHLRTSFRLCVLLLRAVAHTIISLPCSVLLLLQRSRSNAAWLVCRPASPRSCSNTSIVPAPNTRKKGSPRCGVVVVPLCCVTCRYSSCHKRDVSRWSGW